MTIMTDLDSMRLHETNLYIPTYILKLNKTFSATAEQIFIRQRMDSIVVELKSRSNEGQVRVWKVRLLSQANLKSSASTQLKDLDLYTIFGLLPPPPPS